MLGNAFGIASGVVVDTHVSRLSQRLGLTKQKTPEKIEKDLEKLVPKETLGNVSPLADLSRPADMSRPQAEVPGMRPGRYLPVLKLFVKS